MDVLGPSIIENSWKYYPRRFTSRLDSASVDNKAIIRGDIKYDMCTYLTRDERDPEAHLKDIIKSKKYGVFNGLRNHSESRLELVNNGPLTIKSSY